MYPLISGTAPWSIVNLEWEGKVFKQSTVRKLCLVSCCVRVLPVYALMLRFFPERVPLPKAQQCICPYRWKQHRSTAGLKLCQANCCLIIWTSMSIQPAAYECFNSKNGKSYLTRHGWKLVHETTWFMEMAPMLWSSLENSPKSSQIGKKFVDIQETGTSFVRYELKLWPNYCNSYCYGFIMIYNLSFRSYYFIFNC